MKISTFNIKNNYGSYKFEKADKIFKYLTDNKIDILGLQEVFSKCNNDLLKLFDNIYNMVGKYRFVSRLLLRRFNEKNPIVTKYKIIGYKTYHLPFFPSLTKRVMTHALIDYKGNKVSIYNTHLEVNIIPVKRRQLNRIYRIIEKDKYPKILMGDFNLKNNNKYFNEFIYKLENIEMTRIALHEKTLRQSKYSREIDHIFISKEFELKDKKVVKTLDISDHYPVVVDLKLCSDDK